MPLCTTCGQKFKSLRTHWGLSSCPIPESEYYECQYENCNERFPKRHGLDKHENHHPKHCDSGEKCHDCGHIYDRISHHWSGSDECEYPKLTERQHNIIRGLLMGDGSVAYHESKKNPKIIVACIVPEYLEHLSDEFEPLSGSVSLSKTGEQAATENRESGFRPDANGENYSDQYKFNTLATPEMWQYRDWYTYRTTDSGAQYSKKEWPKDLELTPATLTHWFVGDGNNQFEYPSIRLSMNNERQNLDKVESYFERAGLPTPDRWGITDSACNAVWKKESSEELFEYMEGPVPGYEYKWPESVK